MTTSPTHSATLVNQAIDLTSNAKPTRLADRLDRVESQLAMVEEFLIAVMLEVGLAAD